MTVSPHHLLVSAVENDQMVLTISTAAFLTLMCSKSEGERD